MPLGLDHAGKLTTFFRLSSRLKKHPFPSFLTSGSSASNLVTLFRMCVQVFFQFCSFSVTCTQRLGDVIVVVNLGNLSVTGTATDSPPRLR